MFRRFSDPDAIRRAKGRVRAHLYELRLFADDPRATLRAQKNLLLWNARYAALMLRPAAVLLLPTIVLLAGLDCVFGRRPLHPGEAALVMASMRGPDAVLIVPAAFSVETPPVRIPERNEVWWRVRARAAAAGTLRAGAAETTIDARPGFRFLAPGWPVRSVEVDYPPAWLSCLGVGLWWPIPFAVVALATMLAFRNRFGVTF